MTSSDDPLGDLPPAVEPTPASLPVKSPAAKSSALTYLGFALVLGVTAAAIWGARLLLMPGTPVSTARENIWQLQDLVSQYQENRPQAMEEFAGKRVKISTTVLSHLPAAAGSVTVLAGTADRPVYCLPTPASARDFEDLKAGDKIVLAATVSRLGIAVPPASAGPAANPGELQAPAGFTLRDAQLLERRQ
jgi:hypothetical protein